MLKILQNIFLIISVVFAVYSLYTNDFQFLVYMILFSGLAMLVIGLQAFKRNEKITGWMGIGVFAFSIYFAIQIFMWDV